MKKVFNLIFLLLICNSYCQEEFTVTNLEGFYSESDEYSNFMQLDFENSLLIADHWTNFALDIQYNGKPFDFNEIEDLESVYMRVKVILRKGKTNYGHLGAWKSEILITEIIELDKTRSLKKYLIDYGPIKRKRKF